MNQGMHAQSAKAEEQAQEECHRRTYPSGPSCDDKEGMGLVWPEKR